MPRPIQPRRVQSKPELRGLKPLGVPMDELEIIPFALDELEALRLADCEGLYQEEAATRMAISRPTYQRLLSKARAKVASVLFEQKALVVTDGPIFVRPWPKGKCPVHGGPTRRGRSCRCAARNHKKLKPLVEGQHQ